MKKKTLALLILAGLSAGSTSLMARDGDAGNRRGPGGDDREGDDRSPRPMPPLVVALDADHDGIISSVEIANAAAALKSLDKDGDGALTKEELLPKPHVAPAAPGANAEDGAGPDEGGRPPGLRDGAGRRPRGPRPGQAAPLARVLDADHDGIISADEIDNAVNALKSLDKDGDGALAKEEVAPRLGRRDARGEDGPLPGRGPGSGPGRRPGPGGRRGPAPE